MSNDNSKKYPVSSQEIAEIFKLNEKPALPTHEEKHEPEHAAHLPMAGIHPHGHNEGHGSEDGIVRQTTSAFGGINVLKTVAPYFLIFFVAVVIYYFFFSNADLNFGSLFRRAGQTQSVKQGLLDDLKKQQAEGYTAWIQGFYFDVSDQKVLDPDADNSGNGLSNFHKYLLNLNPKSYDTLKLGMADSEALSRGINPLTGNQLTEAQKQVVEKYFDMEVIMNRFTVSHMQQEGQVAGSGVYGSATAPPTAQNVSRNDPNFVDVDTNIPARLEIKSLNVNVPIIWTADTNNFDNDLRMGVVHYPGTALPGQIGTTYISGHSSNFVWAKGDYNHVFSKLGNLKENGSFKITVVQKNGKDARLHYIVTKKQEYQPTDQAQFLNSGKSTVALSTCWPVGSTARRMVVFGELVQVERD
jgi:LPXTG-site transpeptidase (sortase) family protein